MVQAGLRSPADVQVGVDVGLGPIHDALQFRPVIHLLERQVLHRRAGDDQAVELLAFDLPERLVMVEQVLFRGVLRLVGGGVEQCDLHLQRGIAQQAQELRFGLDLGGHQVKDGDAQRADVLVPSAFLAHDKYVLAFEHGASGQGFGNSYGHNYSNAEGRMQNDESLLLIHHSAFIIHHSDSA